MLVTYSVTQGSPVSEFPNLLPAVIASEVASFLQSSYFQNGEYQKETGGGGGGGGDFEFSSAVSY